METRENLINAIKHRQPSNIPYNIFFEGKSFESLANHYGGKEKVPRYRNHWHRIFWEDTWRIPGNNEKFVTDPFGTVWEIGAALHISDFPLKEASLKGYDFPALVNNTEKKRIEEFVSAHEGEFIIYQLGMVFFERAWALRGFENLLMDMCLDVNFTEALLDRLADMIMDAVDCLKDLPLDAFMIGDDYGQQKGLIMGPELWRKFLKPHLKKIYEKILSTGKILFIHSCGDNSEIMGDFVDMGVQVFHPAQPECMDIYKLKREYGRHISFDGGVGMQKLLPFGSPAEIRVEIMKLASMVGKNGGYIIEGTKPFMDCMPVENIAAAIETILEVSGYD